MPVFRSAHTTIYAVPSPRPIVTGPGRAEVLAFGQHRITLAVARPGRYRDRDELVAVLDDGRGLPLAWRATGRSA